MFLKNIIKITGLFVLIVFSFFYSDKVYSVVSSRDELMIKIKDVCEFYYVKSIDGIVTKNTIIPGIKGKTVNVDKSYKKMREIGTFDEKLIIYDDIKPNNSISDNRDKYIIHGNYNKDMVSIIFIVDNDRYLDKIENIILSKNVIANYFVTNNYLIENSTYIASLKNSEVYNYGDNGEYTPDNLIFANNLITRITKNEAMYCLSEKFSSNTLSLCSKNNLYTVVPNIIIDGNLYINIKDKVDNGSIILIKVNNNNITELSIGIDYLKSKGLDIVGLSNLISE